jgi:ribosomal protein L16/L10AE
MGSKKKTAARKGYGGPWSKKAAKDLAKEVKDELEVLLKRTDSGTITQHELKHGLVELTRHVEAVNVHIHRAPEGPQA